jgi:sec-independent protein translocase protein TatA
MFHTIGIGELLVILLIVVVLFGASRLPALGSDLGRTIRGLTRGICKENEPENRSDPPGPPGPPTQGEGRDD